VVPVKVGEDDAGAERPRRVEGPARVVDAQELRDEQRQTDADRCEERRLVLLGGQEKTVTNTTRWVSGNRREQAVTRRSPPGGRAAGGPRTS